MKSIFSVYLEERLLHMACCCLFTQIHFHDALLTYPGTIYPNSIRTKGKRDPWWIEPRFLVCTTSITLIESMAKTARPASYSVMMNKSD